MKVAPIKNGGCVLCKMLMRNDDPELKSLYERERERDRDRARREIQSQSS